MLFYLLISLLLFGLPPVYIYAAVPPSSTFSSISYVPVAPFAPVIVTVNLTTNCNCSDQGTLTFTVYSSDGLTIESKTVKRLSISRITSVSFSAPVFTSIEQEKIAYISLDVPNNLESPYQTRVIDLVASDQGEYVVDFVTGQPIISAPSQVALINGKYVYSYDTYDFSTTVFYIQHNYPVVPISSWRFTYSGGSAQPLFITSAYILLETTEQWDLIPQVEGKYYFPLSVIPIENEYGFILKTPPTINSLTGTFNEPSTDLEGIVTDLVLPMNLDRSKSVLMTVRIQGIGEQQITIVLFHHLVFYRSFFGNCLSAHFCIKQKMPVNFIFPAYDQRTWGEN